MWFCIVTLRFLASCQTVMMETIPSKAKKEVIKIVAGVVNAECRLREITQNGSTKRNRGTYLKFTPSPGS